MATERVKVRGLARIPASLLVLWGAPTALKGLYDLAAGEPEANLYSLRPWQFVTQAQWQRYAAFELVYGLACVGLAALVWSYSRRLPDHVERPARRQEALFQ